MKLFSSLTRWFSECKNFPFVSQVDQKNLQRYFEAFEFNSSNLLIIEPSLNRQLQLTELIIDYYRFKNESYRRYITLLKLTQERLEEPETIYLGKPIIINPEVPREERLLHRDWKIKEPQIIIKVNPFLTRC